LVADVSTTRTEVELLTPKMTSAQVVETSVTNNSSFQNHPHPDNHTIWTNIIIIIAIALAFVVIVTIAITVKIKSTVLLKELYIIK